MADETTVAEMQKPHLWTDGGDKVLILRRCNADMTSSNDFKYPESGVVKCPDFEPSTQCGGGLHGWPWGMGLGEGSDYDIIIDKWLIIAAFPDDIVGELEGKSKCKIRRGDVIHCGSFSSAWNLINSGRHRLIDAMAIVKSVNASGDNGAQLASSGYGARLASSGYDAQLASSGYGARLASSGNDAQLASSGNDAQLASSGNDAQLASSGNDARLASSGYDAQLASSGYGARLASSGYGARLASSGNDAQLASSGYDARLASSGYGARLASSGNDAQLASSGYDARLEMSGENSIGAIAAKNGRIKVGSKGAFAISFWTDADGWRFLTGKVGENGILADTWYQVKDGQLAKCE